MIQRQQAVRGPGETQRDVTRHERQALPRQEHRDATPCFVPSGEITVAYPGPPGRPSDARRLVENRVACTQPSAGYPRVVPHRTGARPVAEMGRNGCPAEPRPPGAHLQDGCGAASRVGPEDRSFTAIEYAIEFLSPT